MTDAIRKAARLYVGDPKSNLQPTACFEAGWSAALAQKLTPTDEMVERAKAAHDASEHWLWRDRWRDALEAALSPPKSGEQQ